MEILINITPCEECKCTHERHISYSVSTGDNSPSQELIRQQIEEFLVKEGYVVKKPDYLKVTK